MPEERLPAIRRARLGTLTIYEISEPELEIIERGSPESIFLNFAIFLLSAAIAFSVALATTSICSNRTFLVFVVITVIGYLAGLLLLIMWWLSHRSTTSITKTIRRRLPPEGEQIQE